MFQRFSQAEVAEVVAQRLEAEEGGELLVHPDHGILGASPKHVMSMVDSLENGLELAAKALVHPKAEHLTDFVRHQAHQAHIA